MARSDCLDARLVKIEVNRLHLAAQLAAGVEARAQIAGLEAFLVGRYRFGGEAAGTAALRPEHRLARIRPHGLFGASGEDQRRGNDEKGKLLRNGFHKDGSTGKLGQPGPSRKDIVRRGITAGVRLESNF